jgi:hypothetical protein
MLTTTQLFVELLVIGIGAVLWVALFVAAVFGYRFDQGLSRLDPSLLFVAGVVAYALGIGVDRCVRDVLERLVENAYKSAIIDKAGFPGAEVMEKYILVSSEPLWRVLQYTRSRLRICRAWVVNALLILAAFMVWNIRLRVVNTGRFLAVMGIGLLVCALMAWAVRALLQDYYENLRESFVFLKESKKPE